MGRIGRWVIAIVLVAIIVSIVVPVVGQETGMVVNANTVNLRSGPGTNFPILTGFPRGTQVTVLARSADNAWVQVSVNNIERVWQMFFGTAFNEHIATKKCRSHPNNVLDLLRQLSREEAITFPYKELGKADFASVDLCIDRLLKYGAD